MKHQELTPRSALVLGVHDLMYHPGKMRVVDGVVQAPSDFGTEVLGVEAGTPMELDLRLESVSEGILVSGTVDVELKGECVRCLKELHEELTVDVQELFVNPDSEIDDEEIPRITLDSLDVEPVIRDQVVLDLPFAPLCTEDCPGLCPECGAALSDEPQHTHGDAGDERWAALAAWEKPGQEN